MSRKLRKQHIALRFRHREQIKHRVRSAVTRSIAVALVVGFGFGMVAGHDSVVLRFLHRHTPQVVIKLPGQLSGLPVLTELPQNRLWLWLPGSAWWFKVRLTHKYTAVNSVYFERSLVANSVSVHVVPRVPLVTWNGE